MGDVKKSRQILNEMKHEYHITPNSVIYSTIISACENINSNGKDNKYNNDNNAYGIYVGASDVNAGENVNVDVKQAMKFLFQEAIMIDRDVPKKNRDNNTCNEYRYHRSSKKSKRMDMNIVVYHNTVLSIFAKAGEWRLVCQLLDEMGGCDCAHNDNTAPNDSSQARNRIVPLEVNMPPPDRITYGGSM